MPVSSINGEALAARLVGAYTPPLASRVAVTVRREESGRRIENAIGVAVTLAAFLIMSHSSGSLLSMVMFNWSYRTIHALHPKKRPRFLAWISTPALPFPDVEEEWIAWCDEIAYAHTWEELNAQHWAQLRSLVKHAQAEQLAYDLGVEVVNESIVYRALRRDKGVLDLLRRVHPYTLQALKERDQPTSRFTYHQGEYFTLYAQSLLGRLPPEGRVVISVDPHADAFVKLKNRFTMDRKTGRVKVFGINDANWAAAAVQDGLARAVIQMTWSTWRKRPRLEFTLQKRWRGRVYIGIVESFADFLEGGILGPARLTVDLDTFDLKKRPWQIDPLEIDAFMDRLLAYLHRNGVSIVGASSATSPDYITDFFRPYVDATHATIAARIAA